MSRRYIIIGASAAGVAAAESIRNEDPQGKITVCTEEPWEPYSRILTTHLIGGEVDKDGMRFKPAGWSAKHGIELRTGCRIASVDPGAGVAVASEGEMLRFDRLLIASGASAKRLRIPGGTLPGVCVVRDLSDALDISDRLDRIEESNKQSARSGEGDSGGKRKKKDGRPGVVFSGGGLVSCKTAGALLRRNVDISIVISSHRILSQMLDPEGAAIVEKQARDLGVNIIFGASTTRINGKTHVESVDLDNGTNISCSLLIAGKGVTARMEFLGGTGIEREYGVVVDRFLETSVTGIFAAGDAAQVYDILRGETWTNAVWPLAVEQGRLAGFNMVHGRGRRYDGAVSANTGDFFGIPAVALGLCDDQPSDVLKKRTVDEARDLYRCFYFRRNRLIGYQCVGSVENAGFFYHLIRTEVPVDVHFLNEIASRRTRGAALLRHSAAVSDFTSRHLLQQNSTEPVK